MLSVCMYVCLYTYVAVDMQKAIKPLAGEILSYCESRYSDFKRDFFQR